MLGANGGRVKTTRAWGWGPVLGGGGGAVGVVLGVLGHVVVAEELAVELGGVGCGGVGWPVAAAVAALVATAAAYWLICCMRFLIKSGGRAPGCPVICCPAVAVFAPGPSVFICIMTTGTAWWLILMTRWPACPCPAC